LSLLVWSCSYGCGGRPDGDSVFIYDLSGHLIEQADATGTVKRELLYLGDLPVGVVQ